MARHPETYWTPEGFDTREDFVSAVISIFDFATSEFTKSYGTKFASPLTIFSLTLIHFNSGGSLSEDFKMSDDKSGSLCEYATHQLAQFLATAKAWGHSEDSVALAPVYNFMKSHGIPIIEYRDKVVPNGETIDEANFTKWKRRLVEVVCTPATSDDRPDPAHPASRIDSHAPHGARSEN